MPSLLAGLMLAALAVPAMASAQDGTVVLGLRAIEGDDELARQLTEMLRRKAEQQTSWSISPREVSLAQMSLVHGCEEPGPSCLTDIALGLDADKLIYGTLRHAEDGGSQRYEITVHLFDRQAERVRQHATETFSSDTTQPDALSQVAARLITALRGGPPTGELAVRANASNAVVWLDGERAGVLSNGTLVLQDVEAGVHTVKVDADGYAPYTTTTTVAAGTPARLQVSLQPTAQPAETRPGSIRMETDLRPRDEPAEAGRTEIILGASLLGGSAVLLGAAIYSWAEIESINDDDRFVAYKQRVGQLNPASQDVCEDAEAGFPYASESDPAYDDFTDVQSMCDRAELLEVLQYVFVGGAVAAAGVGTYFLIRGLQAEDDEASASTAPRFSFTPPIGGRRARVSATLHF